MEQWILDGRSLVRQRDPKKFAFAHPDVQACIEAARPEQRCFTSMLLSGARCRVAPEGGSGGLEFGFDCDAEGNAVGRGQLSWGPGTDLTDLYGLVRRVAPSADAEAGVTPKPYAECVCDILWFYDGELVDEIREFEFVTGAGVVPQAAEEGVLGIAAGGTAAFLCDPGFAFRDNGLPRPSVAGKAVPADACVTLFLRLHRFQNPLTAEEKIAASTKLKEEGNALVKEQQWVEAVRVYQRALTRLTSGASVGSETPEVLEASRQLKATLLHNLAVATLSQDSISARVASQAAGYCTRALAIDEMHAKARYRRALCLLQQREFDDAAADVAFLEKHGLGDPAAAAALKERIERERRGG